MEEGNCKNRLDQREGVRGRGEEGRKGEVERWRRGKERVVREREREKE